MDATYVNGVFKRDITGILGHDPWRMIKTIQYLSQSIEYTFFISPGFMDNLKTFRNNLNHILDAYFTWNESEFPDPLDQYIWIEANMKEVIIPDLLKDLPDIEHRDLVNLKLTSKLWYEKLGENLYKAGLLHKFQYDDRDAHIDEL